MNQTSSYELNFTLPQGPTGPVGPIGPSNIRNAYLATFNNGTVANGIAIPENEALPIDREEANTTGLITLDSQEDTIQFNVTGLYKITFTVSAYVIPNNQGFNPETDFVSIGFRKKDSDSIFIGASQYNTNEISSQIIGQGILSVANTTDLYELANLSKQNIYLRAPKIDFINTTSHFANSVVTIVIEYLG